MSTCRPKIAPRSMYLTGYGKLPWRDVVPLLNGLTCAWADYGGFHVRQSCPEQVPPYSHLWAWSQDSKTLVRVRIDDDKGIVGILSTEKQNDGFKHDPKYFKFVTVRLSDCYPWGDDKQIGDILEQSIANRKFVRYEPLIPLTATFIGPALRSS